MDSPIVPAWLVALILSAASVALLSVRSIPRAIRLSLITPLLYLAWLFTYFHISGISAIDRVDLGRAGICLIGISIMVNSVAARYAWSKKTRL